MNKTIKGMSISKKALSVSVAVATALSLVGIAWASGSSGLSSSSSTSSSMGTASTGTSGAPTSTLGTPTPTSSPSTTSTSTTNAPATGSIDIAAADYQVQLPDGTPVATVTLEVVSSQLNVLNISTEADWQVAEVENYGDGHEIEIYFLNLDGDTRVKFKAELEYGQIQTEIGVRTLIPSAAVAPATFEVQVHGIVIGTVTLEVVDGRLRIVAVNSDWTFRVDDDGDDDSSSEVEIYFFRDGTKAEFKAKLIGGEIRVMTKVENEDHDELDDDKARDEFEDEDEDDHSGEGHSDDDDRGGDHEEGDDD